MVREVYLQTRLDAELESIVISAVATEVLVTYSTLEEEVNELCVAECIACVFINRLSDTVVFHDMDRHMAELILDKKLAQLADKLSAKGVSIELTPQTREQLLKWGFTKEYGAREMDRVIGNRLKPVLMKALLFGKLKKGGKAVVKLEGKELVI